MRIFTGSIALSALIVANSISVSAFDTVRTPQDHATIQAAIDAASAGDTVLVSAGTYKERIVLTDGIVLKSAGDDAKGERGLRRAEATIIDGGGEEGKGGGVTMASGSTIDGFTIMNVGRYDDDKWNKHHATHGNDQDHALIGAPGDPGIDATGVNCTIRNNIVHHIGYSGIGIKGVDGKPCSPHVHHNVCYRNMGGGIASMRKSTAIIEQNICFENFYAGIGHEGASPSVFNNVCYENIRAGIGISEGACPTVRGNQCYNNRRAGIGTRTEATTKPIIEDNDCYDNDMAGIGTDEGAAPLIRGNRCFRNKLAGIGARHHSTPVIIGNECYENGKAGIGLESDTDSVVIDNHSHHNKAAGIGFETGNSGRSLVMNNRVIDNALVAIGIHPGWTVQVIGNELSREGGMPPIVMVFQGSSATFTDNVIRGGGVAGIRVMGTVRAENNEFAGTSMRRAGPPNFALWALPGSDISMTGNKIHGWRNGLQASEATVLATNNTVSNFGGVAFDVKNSTTPANIYSNVAISKNPNDKVASLTGNEGLVEDNRLIHQPTISQD